MGSSGVDISANIEKPIRLQPKESVKIPTGISIAIPEGYEAQIRPRSGTASKNGITILSSPGTIDSDYRGEIKILLTNHSEDQFIINDGDRIAQMVFNPYAKATFMETEMLSQSQRGEKGFGSTGNKNNNCNNDDIEPDVLTPFHLSPNCLASTTGDETRNVTMTVEHPSIARRKQVGIKMNVSQMTKNKLMKSKAMLANIEGQGDTGANTSATNQLDIIHDYIEYKTPQQVSVFIDDEETETMLEAKGSGYILFVSNNGNIMKWQVVYTPQSNGTVLSPDNYHRMHRPTIYAFYQYGNSDNKGSIGFLTENHQVVDEIALKRNHDGQWMTTNQILLPDVCENIHIIRSVMKKTKRERHEIGSRVKQDVLGQYVMGTITNYDEDSGLYWIEYPSIHDSEELYHDEAKQILVEKSSPREDETQFETKTWSSSLDKFLSQQDSKTISEGPSDDPTHPKNEDPSEGPTLPPGEGPSGSPSKNPSGGPSDDPSEEPSGNPSHPPSKELTGSTGEESGNGLKDDLRHHPTGRPPGGPSDRRTQDLELWHQRMGHVGFQTLQDTRRCTKGIPPIPTSAPMFKCPFCEKAKMCKRKGKSHTNDVFIQNQSFHMDLSFVSGPTNLNQVLEEGAKVEKNIQKSREGYIGFLTIIDKASRNYGHIRSKTRNHQ